MLHFAQVQKEATTGETKLRLLARQESEHTWALIDEAEVIPATETDVLSNGLLVLVELELSPTHPPTCQVLSIKDATDWVLNLVKIYLTSEITLEFLQQEKVKVEEGLQTLTLEKLDLSRRLLEVEARREEIQELEAKLKQQMEEIQELEAKLKQQMKDLDEEG